MSFSGVKRRITTCLLLISLIMTVLVWIQSTVYAVELKPGSIKFSEEERLWMKANPVIRLGIDPAWPPFEWFDDKDRYQGISSEYIAKIEAATGLVIKPVHGISWAEVVSGLKDGTLHMSAAITQTPDRSKFLEFTSPYVTYPSVIMTRDDQQKYGELEAYNGKRVGTGNGYVFEELIERQYPDVDLVLYDTDEEGLTDLAVGNIEAYVGNLGVTSYIIRKYNLSNLVVAGQAESFGKTELRMAARKDLVELVSILDKVLTSIPEEEHLAIAKKWANFENSGIENEGNIEQYVPSKTIMWVILFVALFIVFAYLISYLTGLIRKDPDSIKSNTLQTKRSVVIFNALLIALVLLGSSLSLNLIKDRINLDVLQKYNTVLNYSIDEIEFWVEGHFKDAAEIATDPKFIKLAQKVLATHRGKKVVKGSNELLKLRSFLTEDYRHTKNVNYHLIALDGISIGSISGTDMGTNVFLKKNHPNLFERVLEREQVLIPLLPSDLPKSAEKTIDSATIRPSIYLATPIISGTKVVGVLAEQIDPHANGLNRVARLADLGTTAETYIFNKKGELVTESSFEDDLIAVGLKAKKKQSTMNVVLYDPGRNLLETGPITASQDELPLTKMAKQAVTGQSGFDLEGYRDFRGVTVVGAWRWNDNLGIGIAIEQDINEAFHAFNEVQLIVVTLLGVTVVLAFFFTTLNVFIGKKTTEFFRNINNKLEESVQERTAELEMSEERSRMLLESVGEGIFGVDLNGCVTFLNPAAVSMLGFTEDELMGQPVHEMIHHSHIDGSVYPVEDCPMKKTCVEGNHFFLDNEVLWRKDGTFFIVEYRSTPIIKGGKVVGGVVSFDDITQRKKTDEELVKLSRAIEASPVNIVITDPHGIIEYVNPKFMETTGYSYDEAIGRSPSVLKSGEHSKEFYAELWETIAVGGDWQGEFLNKKKNGTLYWESAIITSIKADDGTILNYLTLKEDITEKKKLELELLNAKEDAEAATRAKGDFLANMSHEIRTPMNAIIGFAELALQNQSLNKATREYIRTVVESAKSLLRIINDILDVSKLESGKFTLESISFDLAELLQQIHEMLKVKATSKSLDFSIEISDTTPKYVLGDITRLRQVLLNLVDNSIKFTQTGGVKIVVDQAGKGNADFLKFSIIDTGIGMTAEQIRNIFNPFTQADVSTTRNFGGTGLGTTISSQIINLMKGKIWVESDPGVGSSFYFTAHLPATDCKAVIPYTDLTEKSPSDQKRRFRVLLAEDVRQNATLAQLRLERQGHVVTHVWNGREAVKKCAENVFDLVLMDMMMPEMNGIEATQKIREIEEETGKHIPIIALTASVTKNDHESYRKANLDDAVGKPINFEELFAAMEKVVPKGAGLLNEDVIAVSTDNSLLDLTFLSTVVDIDKGLDTWKDALVFAESLVSFAEKHANDASTIRQLFDDKRSEDLQAMVHRLKGVTGNLYLSKVASVTSEIDLLLTSGNTELPERLLSKLHEELNSVIELIRQIEIPANDKTGLLIKEFDSHVVFGLFKKLLIKLDEDNPEVVEPLIDQLNEYVSRDDMDCIQKAINGFDFDQAKSQTIHVAKKLGLELKG